MKTVQTLFQLPKEDMQTTAPAQTPTTPETPASPPQPPEEDQAKPEAAVRKVRLLHAFFLCMLRYLNNLN